MVKRRGIVIHPEELDDVWVEQISEARLDVLGLHPVGGQNAHQTLEEAVHLHLLPRTQSRLKRLDRMGIEVEYEAHAMAWLLPRTLFSHQPNLFRMDEDGQRTPDFNLCPSNPDALAILEKRAEYLARMLETGAEKYHFWLDDVAGKRCFCPKCRSLSASDQQMLAVNAMLRGIRRNKSGAKLCFLSYVDTIEPPASVAPDSGVFLEYAPFRRNSHVPLFDASCPENVSETRSIRRLMDAFGSADSQVLEYWADNSRFSGWQKPPKKLVLDEAVMREDVKAYAALGFTAITGFGCYLGADYRALWGEAPIRRYGEILRQNRES